MCMTWRDVAQERGFRDRGDGRWLAPNGQIVAEGFVAAVVRDIGRALGSVTRSSLDLRRPGEAICSEGDRHTPAERGFWAHTPS